MTNWSGEVRQGLLNTDITIRRYLVLWLWLLRSFPGLGLSLGFRKLLLNLLQARGSDLRC